VLLLCYREEREKRKIAVQGGEREIPFTCALLEVPVLRLYTYQDK